MGTLLRSNKIASNQLHLFGLLIFATLFSGLLNCRRNPDPLDARLRDFGSDAGRLPEVDGGGIVVLQGNVGASCNALAGSGCPTESRCLRLNDSTGICIIDGCQREDPTTAQREDDCPNGTTCVTIEERDESAVEPTAKNICTPNCSPRFDKNACASINPILGCDPKTMLLSGTREVCLTLACQEDLDCPSVAPSNTICDTKSGLCVADPATPNKLQKIGDACETTAECGFNEFCLTSRSAAQLFQRTNLKLTNGYCTILGCRYGEPWTCPTGSECFFIGSNTGLSICLKTGCAATAAPDQDGCRDSEGTNSSFRCLSIADKAVCWEPST